MKERLLARMTIYPRGRDGFITLTTMMGVNIAASRFEQRTKRSRCVVAAKLEQSLEDGTIPIRSERAPIVKWFRDHPEAAKEFVAFSKTEGRRPADNR